MQDKLSMLIGQPMKETMDEKFFLPPPEFILSEFDYNYVGAQRNAQNNATF